MLFNVRGSCLGAILTAESTLSRSTSTSPSLAFGPSLLLLSDSSHFNFGAGVLICWWPIVFFTLLHHGLGFLNELALAIGYTLHWHTHASILIVIILLHGGLVLLNVSIADELLVTLFLSFTFLSSLHLLHAHAFLFLLTLALGFFLLNTLLLLLLATTFSLLLLFTARLLLRAFTFFLCLLLSLAFSL